MELGDMIKSVIHNAYGRLLTRIHILHSTSFRTGTIKLTRQTPPYWTSNVIYYYVT